MQPLTASQYREIVEESAKLLNCVDLVVATFVEGKGRIAIQEALKEVRIYLQGLPHKHCDHAATAIRHNSGEQSSWCIIKNCECTHTPQSAYQCDRKWERKVD